MKVIKPHTLSLLYAPFPGLPGLEKDPKGYTLSLAVLLGFPFATEGEIQALTEQDLWQIIQEALEKDEVLDIGLPKPRGEFLVYGSCHPRQAQGGAEVLVRVADCKKHLLVFGDRLAGSAGASAPPAFESMPLTWRQTYGGGGFPENPVGKGYAVLPDGKRQLPNVQYQEGSILQREGGGIPASLTAIPPHWPQRRRHLGTVDDSWLQTRWPGVPGDYSHEYACCAPEDQRLPGFFQGAEPFALHGMHPTKAVLQGLVPPVRGRLFVLRQDGAAGSFHEVLCRLETLWLFPGQEAGVLLCRSVTSTVDEECSDIVALLAALESASDAPLPSEHYERLCRESLQPAAPPPEMQPETDIPEEQGPAMPSRAMAAAGGAAVTASPAFQELQESVQGIESEVRQYLLDQGQSYEAILDQLKMQAPGTQAQDLQQKSQEALLQEMEEDIREIEGKVDAFLEEQGLDKEDILRKLETPPDVDSEQTAQYLEELRTLKQQEHLPPELRSELDAILESHSRLEDVISQLVAFGLMQRRKLEAVEQQASGQEAPETAAEAAPPLSDPLSTEEALARLEKGLSLADCDLSLCDFSGQDLGGADLSRAVCIKVSWPGVRLAQARLAGANFQEADLSSAVLDDADCSETVFEKARMDGCSAKRANFSKAQMQFASLARAELEEALCNECDFCQADLRGARLHGLQGKNARLSGTLLAGQHLQGANLAGSRADATTDMSGSRFESCVLDAVCWGGVQLPGARIVRCTMDGGDLAKANLSKAVLHRLQARNAVLLKASLQHARLSGVNLFQASLRWADCTGTVMRNVNLYGADLYRCRINPDLLEDVNSKRTLLDPDIFGGGHG